MTNPAYNYNKWAPSQQESLVIPWQCKVYK